jgi:RimJ/RimL family protein N-acetyltransferase
MQVIYSGERVRLRPFKDAKEFSELHMELHRVPNIVWGCWWHPAAGLNKDFEDAGKIAVDKESAFAIERLDTGELGGYEEWGGPRPGRPKGWVGTFIRPAHWHRGFGIEAKQLCYCFLFENLPVDRVDSATLSNHKRAAHGLHASGMHFEGRLKGMYFSEGKYRDLVCYAIFREEWEQLPIRQVVKRG